MRAFDRRRGGFLITYAISAGLFSAEEPSPSALWELRLLGIDTPAKREELRACPKRRRVRLAWLGLRPSAIFGAPRILRAWLGQDGVSRKLLGGFPGEHVSIVDHDCADPEADTHDTQMGRVILEITLPLGVDVELHVLKAGPSFQDYAEKFRRAAESADVVSLYQSFWGEDARAITKAIRESPSALFISPYVEHAGAPTSTAPQGSACRPWEAGTIGHFVTVAPLARANAAGTILTPTDRGPLDSEAINFIAPSYHASGAGGTCPSAAVAVACALFLYAISPERPEPPAIIGLLRETSTVDRSVLVFEGGFSSDAIDRLQDQIAELRGAPEGRRRKLDAPGVLNLYRAYRRIRDVR